jgi:hypothetical protein
MAEATDTRQLTLSEILGPLTDFLTKLVGKDAYIWWREFKKFLRKERTWEKPIIFKTIQIGTFKDPETLWKAVESHGNRVGKWARDVLSNIQLATSVQVLELVAMSLKELGFSNGADWPSIVQAAYALGLDLCPPEVAAQLRLQYPDQPDSEWLIVAMEPVRDSALDYCMFQLYRNSDDHKPVIMIIDVKGYYSGGTNTKFVFVRRAQ